MTTPSDPSNTNNSNEQPLSPGRALSETLLTDLESLAEKDTLQVKGSKKSLKTEKNRCSQALEEFTRQLVLARKEVMDMIEKYGAWGHAELTHAARQYASTNVYYLMCIIDLEKQKMDALASLEEPPCLMAMRRQLRMWGACKRKRYHQFVQIRSNIQLLDRNAHIRMLLEKVQNDPEDEDGMYEVESWLLKDIRFQEGRMMHRLASTLKEQEEWGPQDVLNFMFHFQKHIAEEFQVDSLWPKIRGMIFDVIHPHVWHRMPDMEDIASMDRCFVQHKGNHSNDHFMDAFFCNDPNIALQTIETNFLSLSSNVKNADDLIPLMVDTCAHASWMPNPIHLLRFVQHYADPVSLGGQNGYILATLEAACMAVCNGS